MRLNYLLCVSVAWLLTACQTLEPHPDVAQQLALELELELELEQEQEQELEIAEQIVSTCEQSAEDVAHLYDCDPAKEGTIPIIHPWEDLDLPMEPEVIPPEVVVTDVWQRVRQQLNFDITDEKRVDSQRQWYLRHPSYMERVAKRAKPFLYLIVEELEQQGMPLELALLPIVESAFDPFAYSHGRAAGMWQFIPSTGKRFGMKQTWWYDGRRDVLASTRGAINYLNYLHDMFDGNWLHALAAYNSGEGRVRRAIRKNKNTGKSTAFWDLDLPRETRAYVPKLLALADILQNAEQYNFSWPVINNLKVTDSVDVGSQIDLALAADMAGLTVQELHALNPGYNRWATDPEGPFEILLPVGKIAAFSEAIAQSDQRLNWVRHKVKGGDSLLKLAHQYHTTTDIISQVNKLKSNMIRLGEHLVIPVALESLDYYSLSKDQRLVSTQSRKNGEYQLKHRVKSGDTFWDISRQYKVNLRSLAKWNAMAPNDPLKPGKELVIWVKKVASEQRKDAVMRTLTYTVRNGDSLARIASKFKVEIADLQRWNQINPDKYLQPGQKLKIFVDVTRT